MEKSSRADAQKEGRRCIGEGLGEVAFPPGHPWRFGPRESVPSGRCTAGRNLFWPRSGVKIFELGPGMKFRAWMDGGLLRLEWRAPHAWVALMAQDVRDRALNALAAAALGSPPPGFRFTVDDRFDEVERRPNLFRRP